MAAGREKAGKMGNEARVDRLEELRVAREQWKESGATEPHQHLQLLMVMVLIRYIRNMSGVEISPNYHLSAG